ncbi:MAG TPA: tetratricopeptide repeat protein, partial [Bryobacteraceae bacterium]
DVPPAWAAIVSAAIEKDPERRLPSMAQALRLCHEAHGSPTVTMPAIPPPPVEHKPPADSFRHRVGLEKVEQGRHTGYSVAVLRLKNLSGGEDGEVFSEGLSEELINSLAKLSNIRVLARTSSFKFQDGQTDPKEIRAKLGATHVIDGSIRKQGNRVRILVRLTNTELETVEWSERYDRQYEDVFAIQDEIGAAVAHVLHVALNESGGRGTRIRTTVPEALDLYLKGRYQLNRSNPVELGNAVRSFEEATRLDPSFALAYSNLADAYLVAAHWTVIPLHDARVRAKAAAQRALDLDPDLAEAHSSMAAVSLSEDWSNFPAAAKGFEKAIALNPSYAPAYFWYGQLILRPLGRIQEALAAAKCAMELDPLSPAMRVASAYTYYYAGDFDRAIREAQSSLDVDPNYIEAAYLQGMAHIAAGNPAKAVDLMNDSIARYGPRPWQLSELGVAQARLGDIAEARATAQQIEAGGSVQNLPPMAAGYVYIALRDFDNANRCLERAYEMKDYRLLSLIGNPSFPEVFTLPEFDRHARRLREIAQSSLTQTHLSGLSLGGPRR